MSDAVILIKTAAGTEEVKARSRKLPPRMRTMLIMADGQLSTGQLRKAAVALGAPEDCLEFLIQHGLIAPAQLRQARAEAAANDEIVAEAAAAAVVPQLTEPERFRAALKFMNDNAVDAMGLRAFFFTLKLEKCYTGAELLALMPDFVKLVTKGNGEDVARVLEARAREIITG